MTQGLELRGAVLGKGYRLGRRIDESDENVYEATHERLPGHFVIRVFPNETLLQPEAASRIQRGARVASLLRDPQAVQLLDCNVSGDVPTFVVTERPQGRTLAEAMSEDGMFPLAKAVPLLESIAAALAAGHRVGLVHGDLRPALITLPPDGNPPAKVAGFGWAKELRAAARLPVPSGYLAPEQQFGKVLTLDERVDQFSLAALAYEMIAACLPFSEESTDLADVATPRTPPAISDVVPGTPKELDEVLRRALSFKPAERFPSVLELAAQLRALIPVEGRGVAPAATTPPATHTSITVVAAIPAAPKTDITEELDMAKLMSAGASGEIRTDGARDDARHHAGAESVAAGEDEDDIDAKLVLGTRTAPAKPAGMIATDDAKTQIRRSPFLTADSELESPLGEIDDDIDDDIDDRAPSEDEDTDLRVTSRPVGATLPRRGPPVGRPTLPRPSDKFPSLMSVPAPNSNRSGVTEAHRTLQGNLAGLWEQIKLRKAWTFPVATGVILLIMVGAMIAISRQSDSEVAAGAAPAPSAPLAQRAAPPPPPAPVVQPRAPEPAAPAPAAAPSAVPPAATAPPATAPDPAGAPPTRGSPPAAGSALATAPAAPAAPGDPAAETPPAAPRPPAAGRRMVVKPSAATAAAPAAGATPRTIPGVGPNDCTIRISSRPWAEVWIDGKNTGRKTPIDNLKVACGTRKLELKRPDKDIEQMEMLRVTPGKPYLGDYELE